MSFFTKKFTAMLLVTMLTLTTFFSLSFRVMAFDLFSTPCSQGSAAHSATCTAGAKSGGDTKSNNIVTRDIKAAADIIAFLAGAIAVIMIVVGGFTLVTSSGSSEAVSGARKRIVNGLIGIAIVALAYAIVSFVIDNVVK